MNLERNQEALLDYSKAIEIYLEYPLDINHRDINHF